jgi:hypothetical protein
VERRPGDLRPGASLTLAEFAAWASPRISAAALGQIVRALEIPPDGTRRSTQAGRPAPTWPAGKLMALHADLAAWLPVPSDTRS